MIGNNKCLFGPNIPSWAYISRPLRLRVGWGFRHSFSAGNIGTVLSFNGQLHTTKNH